MIKSHNHVFSYIVECQHIIYNIFHYENTNICHKMLYTMCFINVIHYKYIYIYRFLDLIILA